MRVRGGPRSCPPRSAAATCSSRGEFTFPGDDASSPPEEAVALIRAYVRSAPLRPVAPPAHDQAHDPAARPRRPAAGRGRGRRGVGAVGTQDRGAVPRARGGDHRRHARRAARRGARPAAHGRGRRARPDPEVHPRGGTTRHAAARGRGRAARLGRDREPGARQGALHVGRAAPPSRRGDALSTPIPRASTTRGWRRAGSAPTCGRSGRSSTRLGASRSARSCGGSGRSSARRATPTCCSLAWRAGATMIPAAEAPGSRR